MAKYSLIDMEKDMRLSEALATLQLPQLKLLKQEFRVVLKEKSGTKEDHVSSIATHAVTQVCILLQTFSFMISISRYIGRE